MKSAIQTCHAALRYLFILILLTGGPRVWAQSPSPAFDVVPLGVRGGLDESNLSAYLVAPAGKHHYIALDAGTLYSGIRKAISTGALRGSVDTILREQIRAYFISHAHLDHLAGLIMNSPEDAPKTIYGSPITLEILQDKYFTWEAWANFADAGEKPQLKKYHYAPMLPGTEISAETTGLAVKAFPLSHGASAIAEKTHTAYYESTAFLVRNGNDHLLYLGDTGADTVEHAGKLLQLWQEVSPLIREGRLKAIFIEVSFPNAQPEKLLFGHLTPRLLMQEMGRLAGISGEKALRQVAIVITHRKPGGDQEAQIRRELESDNPLKLSLRFPEQGMKMSF